MKELDCLHYHNYKALSKALHTMVSLCSVCVKVTVFINKCWNSRFTQMTVRIAGAVDLLGASYTSKIRMRLGKSFLHLTKLRGICNQRLVKASPRHALPSYLPS